MRHNRLLFSLSALTVVVVAAVGGLFLYQTMQNQKSRHVTASRSSDMGTGYRNKKTDSGEYQYNSRITSLLFAAAEPQKSGTGTKNKNVKIDYLAILLLNDTSKETWVVSFDEASVKELAPEEIGGKELLKNVSGLLGNVPINNYLIVDPDSASQMSGILGDEEMPVLAEMSSYPDYMEAQHEYLSSFIGHVKEMNLSDASEAADTLLKLGNLVKTDVQESQYLDLAKKLRDLDYSDGNYAEISTDDRDALQEKVLELFYQSK